MKVAIRAGTEKHPCWKEVPARHVSKGWALHKSNYHRHHKGPRDGWTVTHVLTGRCFLQDLHKKDAAALYAALVMRHPNQDGSIRLSLTTSKPLREWCRWVHFWRYGGYKPAALPRGKLMVPRVAEVAT